nr:rhamnulokinase [Erysipelotrichaceae bacterium]
MKYALAIDIGASSGRHIVGWLEDGKIRTKEVYRFDNGVKEADGHLIWDIDYLEHKVKKGIAVAKGEFTISSLSIDTWGVDYVLLNGDETIYPVYAYRDDRTAKVIDEVHTSIPFAELYEHTGCQFQPFNTIYQLYDDMKRGRLKNATDFLMIPEYLMYRLTGVKKKEFTNATTTGMIDHETLHFDQEIIDRLGLPEKLFGELYQPGEVLGEYDGIKVVLCATHDT